MNKNGITASAIPAHEKFLESFLSMSPITPNTKEPWVKKQ